MTNAQSELQLITFIAVEMAHLLKSMYRFCYFLAAKC